MKPLALTAALTTTAVFLTTATTSPATAATTASAGSGTSAASAAGAAGWTVFSLDRMAYAKGVVKVTGVDSGLDNPTGEAEVTGSLRDRTADDFGCAWVVFRITYYDWEIPKLAQKHFRNCSSDEPKTFAFTHGGVSEIEVKACREGRSTKPTLNCLNTGTWKVLFTAFP